MCFGMVVSRTVGQGNDLESRSWNRPPMTSCCSRITGKKRMLNVRTFLLCSTLFGLASAQLTDPPTPAPIETGTPSLAPVTPVPTTRPSFAPSTARPSTQQPTSAPSSSPTTIEPTSLPSSSPTTREPTASPSYGPTLSPIVGTRSPVVTTETPTTLAPTVEPSLAPTLGIQRYEEVALMFLRFMPDTLTRGQGIDFEVSTEAHIEESLRNREYDVPIVYENVLADVSIQTLLDTGGPRRSLRRLEEDQGQNGEDYILQIEFVVRVTFRSAKTDYDVRSFVVDAFSDQESRNRYIQRLKGSDSAFQFVNDVNLVMEGQSVAPQPDDNVGEDNDIMLYIIAAAGGGCALVLVGLVYLYCSRKSSTGTPEQRRKKDDVATSASSKSPLGMAAEIRVVRNLDDISTLGDPVPITTQPTPDEQTASVGNDYDYSREYRRAHGIASDQGSLERNESVGSRTANSASYFSSSDTSLGMAAGNDLRRVRRFQVTVPPGKLGIVMDNSPSGTPVVYAVKPESVLAKDVQLGDRLLAVDNEDVTVMSAIQVSKLISLKNDQDRSLTFGRIVSGEDVQDL